MKEREYINVSDLRCLSNAINILTEIIPENSLIIDKEKFQAIIKQLFIWREKYYKTIKIKE